MNRDNVPSSTLVVIGIVSMLIIMSVGLGIIIWFIWP
jgi:hypothetical protein